jgi:hypothetical protein
VVAEGVTGWMFESSNLSQLTAVVKHALTCDQATLDAMSRAAEQASARWSVEAAAASLETAVLHFARGHGMPQFAKSSHGVPKLQPQARTSPNERG